MCSRLGHCLEQCLSGLRRRQRDRANQEPTGGRGKGNRLKCLICKPIALISSKALKLALPIKGAPYQHDPRWTLLIQLQQVCVNPTRHK